MTGCTPAEAAELEGQLKALGADIQEQSCFNRGVTPAPRESVIKC
jgi:hypothetical protein